MMSPGSRLTRNRLRVRRCLDEPNCLRGPVAKKGRYGLVRVRVKSKVSLVHTIVGLPSRSFISVGPQVSGPTRNFKSRIFSSGKSSASRFTKLFF